jgi:hypothetical protein
MAGIQGIVLQEFMKQLKAAVATQILNSKFCFFDNKKKYS